MKDTRWADVSFSPRTEDTSFPHTWQTGTSRTRSLVRRLIASRALLRQSPGPAMLCLLQHYAVPVSAADLPPRGERALVGRHLVYPDGVRQCLETHTAREGQAGRQGSEYTSLLVIQ